jgi:hypothetical protein
MTTEVLVHERFPTAVLGAAVGGVVLGSGVGLVTRRRSA